MFRGIGRVHSFYIISEEQPSIVTRKEKTLVKLASFRMSPSTMTTTPMTTSSGQNTKRDDKTTAPLICSVNDYQVVAKRQLPQALYEYLASGSEDEQTLHENRAGFKGWFLRPRVMRPVAHLQTGNTVVKFPRLKHHPGMRFGSLPLFVSPAGVHALCCPSEGECATARACAAMGLPFGLSQHATRTIEQVAAATASAQPAAQNWYQAYILKDRARTVQLIERAAAAGYEGVFLTVDSVRFGFREADARNGFDALPPPHRLVNYDGFNNNNDSNNNDPAAPRRQPLPGQSSSIATMGGSSSAPQTTSDDLEETYNGRQHQAWDQNSELMFAQDVSWDDVRWLKRDTVCRNLPLIVKGIMTAEDAVLAVQAGADGVMVSNHGGRQQDGCLGTIDVLEQVVQAVPGTPVFLDGGVRRGTDILKALALGAAAVGIGKPVFFALAVDGEAGVRHVFEMMQRELEAAMALTGCQSVADITRALVTRHPLSGGGHSGSSYIRSAL